MNQHFSMKREACGTDLQSASTMKKRQKVAAFEMNKIGISNDTAAGHNTTSSRMPVAKPSMKDVLLGRGKPFQNHPGNQRMLKIVNEHKGIYTNTRRENRRALAEKVLDIVLETGARFLKRVEGQNHWEEVGRSVAYDKVSHALRSKGKKAETYNTHDYFKQPLPSTMLSNNQFFKDDVLLPQLRNNPYGAYQALSRGPLNTEMRAPAATHSLPAFQRNSFTSQSSLLSATQVPPATDLGSLQDEIMLNRLARAQAIDSLLQNRRMSDSLLPPHAGIDPMLLQNSEGKMPLDHHRVPSMLERNIQASKLQEQEDLMRALLSRRRIF